jgi:RanGTP-binding protein
MNYAIRSGIAITSGYAIKQCSQLLKKVEGHEREQIAALQNRLESKIRIISPAIDMIELIAARGNTSLDSAVSLTKSIRYEIQALGMKLAGAVNDETGFQPKLKSSPQSMLLLNHIIQDIKALLNQIEDAVPLINLAITTSGVNLSTSLPATVSPSRLLQASTFLSAGDSAYGMLPGQPTQIGPAFVLSLYMLFEGHSRPTNAEGIRNTTWKEVIHKARVKLLRVPLDKLFDLSAYESDSLKTSTIGHANAESGDYFPRSIPSDGKAHEFAYQLLIIEDLDDDRVHTFEEHEEKPGPFDDVAKAGIREVLPLHEISKIFYADTGKILNIGADGEPNNPVLLLKRDILAIPPRRMVNKEVLTEDYDADEGDLMAEGNNEEDDDDSISQLRQESSILSKRSLPSETRQWRFPAGLDPEWLAFEVFIEEQDSDDEDDVEPESSPANRQSAADGSSSPINTIDPMNYTFSRLNLRSSTPNSPKTPQDKRSTNVAIASPIASPFPANIPPAPSTLPALRTSLSLLELLIRLTALQQFQQCSHLAISDELLNFFLSESSSTGSGADAERRKMMRSAARRKVGFDPYAESPIKLRGEDYLHEHDQSPSWIGEYDDEDDLNSPNSMPLRGNSTRRDSSHNSPHSIRSPLHNRSSPQGTSPSPSARAMKNVQRQPGFGPPVTPPGVSRTRTEILRRDNEGRKRSPLARSGSDSTLGANPGASK